MDMISRAMEKGTHLCENMAQEGQTWEKFEECKKGRKLFIFGVGGGLDYFLRNCCNHMQIVGVIDSDKRKQGQRLGSYCGEAWHTEYEELRIQNPNVLKRYRGQDIIVLITSTNFYVSMVEQLEGMGIKCHYVLPMLEINRRKALKEFEKEDFGRIRNEYIEWCCCQKIENNKVIMLIGVYGEHARAITRALLGEQEELDIVWVVNDLALERPDEVRLVYQQNWKQYIYEMETAKIWLFDDLVPTYIRKREHQVYIQVKHWSSITLQSFYLDDKSSCVSENVVEAIRYDGARMDYLFSGSEFDEDSCRSGFGFKGKVIRVGSARSDLLFDKTIRASVLARLGLKENARVCLYVPTYRADEYERNRSMSIQLDMELLRNVIVEKWGGEWYLLVRLHPSLNFGENVLPEDEHIVNAGAYPSSEELAVASDVMITDYSSIMFEAAYKKSPVFLYAPDRREYIDGERGLLIDYDTLPFAMAESNETLCQNIMRFDQKSYAERVGKFLEKYGVHEDGHASGRAAKFMMEILKKDWKDNGEK